MNFTYTYEVNFRKQNYYIKLICDLETLSKKKVGVSSKEEKFNIKNSYFQNNFYTEKKQ